MRRLFTFFFFNDTATTEIYTLSLHDALPISQKDPDLLIGARLNAPLVVGIGDKEWFVASDITAVIPYTKKVLLLGEGEMVAISRLGPEVSTIGGTAVKPKVIEVKWDISQAQKGGFPQD